VKSWSFDRSSVRQDAINTNMQQHHCGMMDRRSLLHVAGFSAASVVFINPNEAIAADKKIKDIAARLEDTVLVQPPVMAGSRAGTENTYYPDFLEGTWDVTQTLTSVQAPLGLTFIGGPNAVESIAEKSMAESQKHIGEPVKLRLQYVKTPFGVAEDRVYNTVSRLNAFAGKSVVASADYADVGASNRAALVAAGGSATGPLQTVFVRFKGPAAQKVFYEKATSRLDYAHSLDKTTNAFRPLIAHGT
jgi:hypothetical protein